MEFGVVIPTVGVDFTDVLDWARTADEIGFDSVWVVDHLSSTPPDVGIFESWTCLSAIAQVTHHVDLGAQVLCTGFRPPAVLAKMATTLDEAAGGRLRVVLGAGWNVAEYRGFGLPFRSGANRVAELEDTIHICRGLWDSHGEPFSYEGQFWTLDAGINRPWPKRRIPIGIGGTGSHLLDLAARFGDEWNCPAQALDRHTELSARLDAALETRGRRVRRSIQTVFNPTGQQVSGRRASYHPELGLVGPAARMIDRVNELAAVGVNGLYGYVLDRRGLELMANYLPPLREAAPDPRPSPAPTPPMPESTSQEQMRQ